MIQSPTLYYLDGKRIDCTEAWHPNMDQRRFLKQIEREAPANWDLHLIVDNSAAHKSQHGAGRAGQVRTVPHALQAEFDFVDDRGRALVLADPAGTRTGRQLHQCAVTNRSGLDPLGGAQ